MRQGMSSAALGGGMGMSYKGAYGERSSAKLTSQEEEIISVAFEAFCDERRLITTSTLTEAFAAIGGSDAQDIQYLIADIDENGDGEIDEEEFRHIMVRKFLGEDDDSSFMHAFEMFDRNKDGFIPLVEFRYILMNKGNSPLNEQEVDELMMFADLEGDGLIDYKDFLRWLANPNPDQGPEPQGTTAPAITAPTAPALTAGQPRGPGSGGGPGAGLMGGGGPGAGRPAPAPAPAPARTGGASSSGGAPPTAPGN